VTGARSSPEASSPPAPGSSDEARAQLAGRCNDEEAYEFMLAYASQGLPNEQGSVSGSQIREFLRRCDGALTGLADLMTEFVRRLKVDPPAPYLSFIAVLERDAKDAQAAVQLVLAQRSIGSQMIDNLNASIHLRALLTDLFLIDEILRG
jgi:hypothetical protein